MTHLAIAQRVRLTENLPNLDLCRGQTGVVCSVWAVAGVAYEVEFPRQNDELVHVLLAGRQIEPDPAQN